MFLFRIIRSKQRLFRKQTEWKIRWGSTVRRWKMAGRTGTATRGMTRSIYRRRSHPRAPSMNYVYLETNMGSRVRGRLSYARCRPIRTEAVLSILPINVCRPTLSSESFCLFFVFANILKYNWTVLNTNTIKRRP